MKCSGRKRESPPPLFLWGLRGGKEEKCLCVLKGGGNKRVCREKRKKLYLFQQVLEALQLRETASFAQTQTDPKPQPSKAKASRPVSTHTPGKEKGRWRGGGSFLGCARMSLLSIILLSFFPPLLWGTLLDVLSDAAAAPNLPEWLLSSFFSPLPCVLSPRRSKVFCNEETVCLLVPATFFPTKFEIYPQCLEVFFY